MKSDTGNSLPLWAQGIDMPPRQELSQNLRTDVCVIGAGFAGLTTAYLLLKEGRQVVVLEDSDIGGGESCRTTAHLSNEIDDRYVQIERIHGQRGAALAAEAHTAAINRVENLCLEENIDAQFCRLDGYLFRPPGEDDDLLQREYEAAHRAGLVQIRMVDRAPLGDYNTGPCIRFPAQRRSTRPGTFELWPRRS